MNDYEKHSHSHCWESENPPCGIKGKHRCCLCEEPVPQEKNSWQERFTHFWNEKSMSEGGISHAEGDDFVDFIRELLSTKAEELEKRVEGMKLLEVSFNSRDLAWKQTVNRNLNLVLQVIKDVMK